MASDTISGCRVSMTLSTMLSEMRDRSIASFTMLWLATMRRSPSRNRMMKPFSARVSFTRPRSRAANRPSGAVSRIMSAES